MLAAAAAMVKGAPVASPAPVVAQSQAPAATPAPVMPASRVEQELEKFDAETVTTTAAPASPTVTPAMSTATSGAETGELARARAIAQRLGITNLTDDEYDIPAYIRRQQDREV